MLKRVVKSTSTNNAFEIIVITAEGTVSEEATTCNILFEAGLSKLHIRKPGASAVQIKTLIQAINPVYHSRTMVHEHHELVKEMSLGGYHIKSKGEVPRDVQDKHVSKSFHSFKEIQSSGLIPDYGFLSPVFDSLSKPGYSSRFTTGSLKDFLIQKLPFPVYALGGITNKNIALTQSLGFRGAAVLGHIWQEISVTKRLEKFELLKKQV